MKMSDEPIIRQATKQDIIDFYGSSLSRTIKAWAVIWKGKIVCIAGVTVEWGGQVAFSDVKEYDAPKLTTWRTIKKLMSLMEKTDAPILSSPDGGRSTSEKLLKTLGFCDSGKRLEGKRIFVRVPR